MGTFLGFGFLGTRGLGSGFLLGLKIHQGDCLDAILRDYRETPKGLWAAVILRGSSFSRQGQALLTSSPPAYPLHHREGAGP